MAVKHQDAGHPTSGRGSGRGETLSEERSASVIRITDAQRLLLMRAIGMDDEERQQLAARGIEVR